MGILSDGGDEASAAYLGLGHKHFSGLLKVSRWLLGANLRASKQSLAEVEHWCVGLDQEPSVFTLISPEPSTEPMKCSYTSLLSEQVTA